MPLSSDTIPNKSLNGQELLEITVAKVRDMLQRDCFFSPTVTYARVAFTAVVTYHTSSPVLKEFEVRTRARPSQELGYEGEAPLKDPPPDAQLVALERTVELENPNLERVHAGLPIKTVTRKGHGPTTPGDPFPSFETHEIRYDPHDYSPPPEPKDEDVSLREARKLGLLPNVPNRAVTPPVMDLHPDIVKDLAGKKIVHVKPLVGEDPDLIKGKE